MEKLEVKKHDHTFTEKLKNIIFAMVMLAPFIAIAIECLLMIQNPNAIDSYTGTPQDLFYNAVDNISTKALFNWTTNTAIYQPINAMITGLEIGTTTIQILLTYWALMTAVYIVFDLIIFIFTKITHLANG